jgi:RNA polymerase sigma-70 factor, ECF subfamily
MSSSKSNPIFPMQGIVQLNGMNVVIQSKYHVTTEQMSEEMLQIEAAKKDSNYFGSIYERYYKQIFGYVNQKLEDRESAGDITAQVFLKALTNLNKYQFKGVPFASWLYRIAQSEVYQSFRDKKSQKTINTDVGDLRNVFEELEEEHYEEYKPKLLKLIERLPQKDKHLVQLRFFEKKAFKEIADEMGITENNAKVRLYRILERMKKSMIKKG